MKALVLKEYNKLVYEDIPVPEFGEDEVLIRVKACGICGSDIHGLDGSTGRRVPPLVMGHEASGIVVGLGSRVSDLRAGERVTFDSTIYCGACEFCREGRINLCDNRRVIGVSCDEYRRNGAFAEYIAVPGRCVYPIPDTLSFEQAATVEPLSVAVHAVSRTGVSSGDTAVVVGAGMVGLLAIQVLRARGCKYIYAADIDLERLRLACKLGADEGFNPSLSDLPAEVFRRTGGRGADVVLEAVGLTSTVQSSVALLRKGGSLALVGNLSAEVGLPLQKTVARELSLYGSCASSGEYPECLEMLSKGVVKVDELLSASVPLADGAGWFERLYRGEKRLIKVCLLP
ncbi:MAG TPA: galactitol-1-phosphate 5-dehydrogenase [archaeon]|nr:galactitol-1-phosphate 5-dehydrogenase [archaeon]